jgi:hypothetical protein
MPERYWLVHPNGGRQLIDPDHFDLGHLAEQARRLGGRLIVEEEEAAQVAPPAMLVPPAAPLIRFEPPISALGPLFRARLELIYICESKFYIDMNIRPTGRVLGGYYRRRCLVRVYTHDRQSGRRPLEELFDTFLHEVAHHLEYTEPHRFDARRCGRVHGRMHSELFWRILAELKRRWQEHQRR